MTYIYKGGSIPLSATKSLKHKIMDYTIFKTDLKTNHTEVVCWGSYSTVGECKKHWQGFYGGAVEAYRQFGFKGNISVGHIKNRSILLEEHAIEYFVMFGEDGKDLRKELLYK